jgi:predicted amino acid dehydrogenase/acyl carrier protein
VARSAKLNRYFELLGFTPLDRASIEDGMDRLLHSDESSVVVCGADWTRLASTLSGFETDSRFLHLVDNEQENGGGSLIETLITLEPARRRELLAKLITAQTAEVLGIPTDQIPRDRRLGELGLDSLMAFELASTLEAKLGRRLPIATLQGNRSVAELAERIERVVAGAAESATDAPNVVAPPAPAGDGHAMNGHTSVNGHASANGHESAIRLRVLPRHSLIDPDVRFDSAALTYIPEDFLLRGKLSDADLRIAFGEEPFLSCVIEASIGRVGAFMLPVTARELFSEPSHTRELVHRSIELASAQGAKVMTLTGLLPSATGYGEGLGLNGGRAKNIAVTTGHALTTAIIVTNMVDLLDRCGRSIESEDLSIVGLGSVGRSVLELIMRRLARPRKLVLCDIYSKMDDLEALRLRVRDEYQYAGVVEIVSGDNGLPNQVLGTRLIISAVDRTGLIDPDQLAAGTILLDDSYPPTFETEAAWERMKVRRDVVIASGGFARLPDAVKETLYVPDTAQVFVNAYGEEKFLHRFEREARDYTACVFAGPLVLRDPAVRPELGIPTPESLEDCYGALARHGIGSAKPQCGGLLIPDTLFAHLRSK